MASALRQPVLSFASKLMHISPKSVTIPVLNTITSPMIATRGLTLTLSRNLWCASSKNSIFNTNKNSHKHSNICGCRYSHTEGDKALASFLEKEIEDERQVEQPATAIEGWNVKADGSGVILSKKFNDENITVEFDVNNSVDTEDPLVDQDDRPELVSKPPFEVTIQKKSGKKLRFFCEFSYQEPQFEDDGTEPQDSVADQFSIVEVRLGDDTKSGELDKYYSHSGAVMDGTLYDLLMDMLDERGIDDDFMNNLVSYATAYEYKLYLNFLEGLKNIVNEK